MTFWGRYGHLSSVDAARESLIDIAENVDPKLFDKSEFDESFPVDQRYDLIRLKRTIYGLQRVIWLNGGTEPITWLPKIFDPKDERIRFYSQKLIDHKPQKLLTNNTKDGDYVETKQEVS